MSSSPTQAPVEPTIKLEDCAPGAEDVLTVSTYPKGGKKRKSPSGSSTSAAVGLPTDSSSATEADVKPDIDSSDLESATPTEARKKPRVTKATTATNDDLHSTPKREPSAKVGPSSPGEFTLEKKERLKAMVFMAGLAVFDQKEAAILLGLSVKQISNALCSGRKGNLRDHTMGVSGL